MERSDREMISALFERMGSVRIDNKDMEAESFIHGSMRQNPDSPYLLVQTVLAQEQALENANARIAELERQTGQGAANGPAPSADGPAPWEAAPAAAAGGAAGSTKPTASGWWGSKPANDKPPAAAAARSTPPPYNGTAGSSGAAAGGAAGNGSVPSTAVPSVGANGARGNPQRERGGSSFMRQAATTATGVAGGMLLANALSGLFGGQSSASQPATAETSGASSQTAENAGNDAANAQEPAQTAEAAQPSEPAEPAESNLQDASHDENHNMWGDDSDWGGDDWGGGDFDI